MTRTIKFRGKSVRTGDWHYGDLVHNAVDSYSHLIEVGIQEDRCYPIEVIPESIGMFTGLVDKEGNEIYEGDIVHDCDDIFGYTFPVCFDSGSFIVDDENEGKLLYEENDNVKVMGNIHDNPELL